MNQDFNAKLITEVIRILETENRLKVDREADAALAIEEAPFRDKVVKRAKSLVRSNGIDPALRRALGTTRLLTVVLSVVFFIFGALAATQAFSQSASGTVNFYWLILVLLGFNYIAIVIWFASLLMSIPGGDKASGLLAGLHALHEHLRWPGRLQAKRVSLSVQRVIWQGAGARWLASRLSHILWSGYLLGGLAMILVMLTARQYTFVWETTLLDADAFIRLTKALSTVPAMLGFPVPDAGQVSASHLQGSGSDPAIRRAWAGLLVGSIVVYGLVPRLVLAVLSNALLKRARSRFRVPLHLPYYIELRHKLMPATRALGVVDPDTRQGSSSAALPRPQVDSTLPDNALYAGVELNSDHPWPPPGVQAGDDLGCIDDATSRQRAISAIASAGKRPLVAVVSVQRSPDRGLARLLSTLKNEARGTMYLALAERESQTEAGHGEARESDWYQLASTIGIEADHIVHLYYGPLGHGQESR